MSDFHSTKISEVSPKKPRGKQKDPIAEKLAPESDSRLLKSLFLSLVFAGLFIYWASFIYEAILPDLVRIISRPEETQARIQLENLNKQEEKPKPVETPQDKPEMSRNQGSGGSAQATAGKPNAPVTRGVLQILSAKSSKSTFSAYDLMSNQNFAKDINQVLQNVSGLQTAGQTQTGVRSGAANVGRFNQGHAQGGGSGGVGDVISSLFPTGSGGVATTARGQVTQPSAREIDMGTASNRSRESIMRVIRARSPGLRNIYTRYLRRNPGFFGKVSLRFTIAPGGEIINISIVDSTTGIAQFDNEVMNAVRIWVFEPVPSGNTTVTVPFTFSE
jgi:TonB family protein